MNSIASTISFGAPAYVETILTCLFQISKRWKGISTPGFVIAKNRIVPPGVTDSKVCLTAEGTPAQRITKSASIPSLFFFTSLATFSFAFIATSAPNFFAIFNRCSLMSVAKIFLAPIAFASFICKSPAMPLPRIRTLCSGFISAILNPLTTQASGSINAPSS